MKTPVSSYFSAEAINSLTHALGVVFGCLFIPSMIAFSLNKETIVEAISVSVYGLCYVTTFTFSTLYHAATQARLKRKFELLDHISIYFLIAATYTAFILHYMQNSQGFMLLFIIWSFVLTGVFFEWFYLNRFILISVASYVSMGLLFIFVSRTFFANMPSDVIVLIYAGVLLYLLGIVFFLWRRLRHHHAVWHLFVLAGSICHFEAVWLSVIY
jgi:hemolysin III